MTEYEYNYENYYDEMEREFRKKRPIITILLIVISIVIITIYKCLES